MGKRRYGSGDRDGRKWSRVVRWRRVLEGEKKWRRVGKWRRRKEVGLAEWGGDWEIYVIGMGEKQSRWHSASGFVGFYNFLG